jgi:predicted SprT family Zn-dependent metalloprotease
VETVDDLQQVAGWEIGYKYMHPSSTRLQPMGSSALHKQLGQLSCKASLGVEERSISTLLVECRCVVQYDRRQKHGNVIRYLY